MLGEVEICVAECFVIGSIETTSIFVLLRHDRETLSDVSKEGYQWLDTSFSNCSFVHAGIVAGDELLEILLVDGSTRNLDDQLII